MTNNPSGILDSIGLVIRRVVAAPGQRRVVLVLHFHADLAVGAVVLLV